MSRPSKSLSTEGLFSAQRMLGHAKASMTLDVHADLFDDDLDSVAESLDAAIIAARHKADMSQAEPPDKRGVRL